MTERTIEQLRAENALNRVNELNRDKPDEFKKRYRSYADSLGPTILMNGLGQALAVELAAAGPTPNGDAQRAHNELYNSIERWLCCNDGVYPPEPGSKADLMKAIMSKDEAHYLRAQAEALEWLKWHKKFCRAYFPADDGAENDSTAL